MLLSQAQVDNNAVDLTDPEIETRFSTTVEITTVDKPIGWFAQGSKLVN